MKYLKIVLGKGPGGLGYPMNYQSEIGDFAIDHLYYNENDEPRLLLVIPDRSYNVDMIRTSVTELTETEARALGDLHDPNIEKITNEAVVKRIEIKSNLGRTLTPDEEKALDQNDPALGFGWKKGLSDRITEEIQIEISHL